MNNYGVNYEAGIDFQIPNVITSRLSPDEMQYDLRSIRESLHANSVRIYGTDISSIFEATEIALNTGLNVWLSPRLINGSAEQTIAYIESCAEKLEVLRRNTIGTEIVLIIGNEFTLDIDGLVAGKNIMDRARKLFSPLQMLIRALHFPAVYQRSLEMLIHEAAYAARRYFKGRITYSTGLWESIDWTPFDIVSVNYYRAAFNERTYIGGLRRLQAIGKPVAITEFGCCTYLGADKRGPSGHNIVDRTTNPARITEHFIRSEGTQARLITELLGIYEIEGIDTAFIFDFIERSKEYSSDADFDLDRASYGIVAKLPGNESTPIAKRWQPKKAFESASIVFKELENNYVVHSKRIR